TSGDQGPRGRGTFCRSDRATARQWTAREQSARRRSIPSGARSTRQRITGRRSGPPVDADRPRRSAVRDLRCSIPPAMSATILIVEDEFAVARGIQYALQQEGYQVAVARSGEDGLDLAVNQAPDLVVLDVRLPGID